MEAILSSQAADLDTLPPQLSYGLDPTGSFVLAKREATIYALGSTYSPNSVKMISIPFGSVNEWLDPQTVCFCADFKNPHATDPCWPASPDPNVLFETIEIRMGGTLIERVTEIQHVRLPRSAI